MILRIRRPDLPRKFKVPGQSPHQPRGPARPNGSLVDPDPIDAPMNLNVNESEPDLDPDGNSIQVGPTSSRCVEPCLPACWSAPPPAQPSLVSSSGWASVSRWASSRYPRIPVATTALTMTPHIALSAIPCSFPPCAKPCLSWTCLCLDRFDHLLHVREEELTAGPRAREGQESRGSQEWSLKTPAPRSV